MGQWLAGVGTPRPSQQDQLKPPLQIELCGGQPLPLPSPAFPTSYSGLIQGHPQ